MKIVHVTRSLIINSGVSVFAAEVAGAQAEMGHDVYLRYTWYPGYPVSSKVNCKPFVSLGELGFFPDIVHIHAFWSMDMVRAMRWCRRNHVPYVVSPHGGLMPRVLRKGWLKKQVFYWLFLWRNLQEAFAIHCTGEGEVTAVKTLGLRAKTFVIPLGCHLPTWPIERLGEEKTILFLSRISEEKGLLQLLEAWKGMEERVGWRLVLAGPDWRGFRKILERKIEQERIQNVEFTGPADGKLKDRLYRMASVFVLPSPAENFSMVVLDALAYGVPVICTQGTPWRVIEERKCGWWVPDSSAQTLLGALLSASADGGDLFGMGFRARALAEEYSWQNVSNDLVSVYSIACEPIRGDSGR